MPGNALQHGLQCFTQCNKVIAGPPPRRRAASGGVLALRAPCFQRAHLPGGLLALREPQRIALDGAACARPEHLARGASHGRDPAIASNAPGETGKTVPITAEKKFASFSLE